MIDASQLRELIIKPALNLMRLYSEDAIELLMFTAAVESQGGTYLKQVKGPALGIYQMEPRTHNDIWQNFLRNRTDILYILSANFLVPKMPDEDRLIYDLYYATALCRIYYLRCPSNLPDKNNVESIWEYYKNYYNTPAGKAKKDKCIQSYLDYLKK